MSLSRASRLDRLEQRLGRGHETEARLCELLVVERNETVVLGVEAIDIDFVVAGKANLLHVCAPDLVRDLLPRQAQLRIRHLGAHRDGWPIVPAYPHPDVMRYRLIGRAAHVATGARGRGELKSSGSGRLPNHRRPTGGREHYPNPPVCQNRFGRAYGSRGAGKT